MSTAPNPIVGKWRSFWTSRPGIDKSNNPYICEYTAAGEWIQEWAPWPDGTPLITTTKCIYNGHHVRHLMTAGRTFDFTYIIDPEGILVISTECGDTWKLRRVTD